MSHSLTIWAASETVRPLSLEEFKWKLFDSLQSGNGRDWTSNFDIHPMTFKFSDLETWIWSLLGTNMFLLLVSMAEPMRIFELLSKYIPRCHFGIVHLFSCRRKCRSFHGCFPGLPWWYVCWMDWNGPWASAPETQMYLYIPQGRMPWCLSW